MKQLVLSKMTGRGYRNRNNNGGRGGRGNRNNRSNNFNNNSRNQNNRNNENKLPEIAPPPMTYEAKKDTQIRSKITWTVAGTEY